MELTALELSLIGCVLLTISLVFVRHRVVELWPICFILGTLFLIKASFVSPAITVPVMLIYAIAALYIVLFYRTSPKRQPSRSR